MSAASLAHEASAVLPCDRELSTWQGRIANAATNGAGLDEYRAALNWAKQDVPTENGVREKVKQEMRDAAERHLGDVHGVEVLDEIYAFTFPQRRAMPS